MLRRKATKRLGEILIDATMITERDLDMALDRQKDNGKPIGKNLVELGCINEDRITQCLAEQYRVPYISLDRYQMNTDLLHLIPEPIVKQYGIIPLDLIGDILTVGIMDVPDEETVKRVRGLTGFKIQVMLITPSDFKQYALKARELFAFNGNGGSNETEAGKAIATPRYEGKERRRFRRFDKELKVKYEYRNEYNINASLNISRCGILIKSKSDVPFDSHLVIRLELPTHHEDLIIISRVVRVERSEDENSFLIALSFGSMDAHDSKYLSEFMQTLTK